MAPAACSVRARRTTVQASVSLSLCVSLVLMSQDGSCASRHHVCVSGRKRKIERQRAKGQDDLPASLALPTVPSSHGHLGLVGGR